MDEDTVTITRKKYKALLKDSLWVDCLDCAGVDNWVGYDYALELFEERNDVQSNQGM